MAPPSWHEEEISRGHDRDSFDCGNPELNLYLKRYAYQNHRKAYTRTFVLVADADPTRILGFYSLCNASVEFAQLPEELAARLPKYPVPAVRLSQLARDVSCKGQGLGAVLLLCAAERALRATRHSGAAMLLIDAADEKAARFYRVNDAMELLDNPFTLVISLESLRRSIAEVQANTRAN